MPLSKFAEQAAWNYLFGDTNTSPPSTYYAGLVLQCGQLSTALVAGTSYTSLACTTDTVAYNIAAGDTLLFGSTTASQAVVTSALANSGATSVSVNSFIANASYAIGTPFIRCDVYATAQEPSGNAYAREAYTNNTTNFPSATGNDPTQKQNATAITFPTATGSWGTVAGFLLGDNVTPGSGNIWQYGMLNLAQAIGSGNTPSFAIDALTLLLT